MVGGSINTRNIAFEPIGMYFLLCLEDGYVRFLRDWRVKALLVFGVASSTEVMQACGIPVC